MLNIAFDNSYVDLGDSFYVKTKPDLVPDPELIRFNQDLSAKLGLQLADISKKEWVNFFSGNSIAKGSEPLAMAYAGHQFGQFNPQLGDGRAILLGETLGIEGERYDIQLKGSGRTKFSRGGDGKSALGPVMREYIVSEAMAAFGIPTTRALAAVTTGEDVHRTHLVPGGILTRVARGFVRVGTFQFYAARKQFEQVKQLADYVIQRNYPQLIEDDNPYLALLQAVIERQANLIAQWMHVGFIHGVMNTDNMTISGETIDYGPCAFMDTYKHDQLYSSIDRDGRYAYDKQSNIAQWNLVRLAECLLPLLDEDEEKSVAKAQDAINQFAYIYRPAWLSGMRKKLGLFEANKRDKELADSFLKLMESGQADYTLSFYYLSQLGNEKSFKDNGIYSLFNHEDEMNNWLEQWRTRLQDENSDDDRRQKLMQSVNPVYIPRNHQIEAAIRAGEDHNDFAPFHALHEVLQQPYNYQQGKDEYMLPPKPEELVTATFCGT